MYVAEWLLVEYKDDTQVSTTLKLLFDELSTLALTELEKLVAVGFFYLIELSMLFLFFILVQANYV